jgi:hypothetical protein
LFYVRIDGDFNLLKQNVTFIKIVMVCRDSGNFDHSQSKHAYTLEKRLQYSRRVLCFIEKNMHLTAEY